MLSQSVGYAASALGYLAASGGKPLLVKEMAVACDIPPAYLAKIINILARKGVVATQRGIGGGVTLAHAAASLSLYDLCAALDDPIVQSRCMLNTAECSDERACPAHEFWKPHRLREVEFLKQTSVADVAAFETNRRWRKGGPVVVSLGGVRGRGGGERGTPGPAATPSKDQPPSSPPTIPT
jgi:Rrf2 family protein